MSMEGAVHPRYVAFIIPLEQEQRDVHMSCREAQGILVDLKFQNDHGETNREDREMNYQKCLFTATCLWLNPRGQFLTR